MARNRNTAPADGEQGVTRNSSGEVESATLDEVIAPGDERHGVHDPLPPERDGLRAHAEPSPAEVFEDVSTRVDLLESDLEGESGHRGAVVRNVTPTPEQAFASESVATAVDPDEAAAAERQKREADDAASTPSTD